MFIPKYIISNKILKNIGIIEACKQVVDHAPILPYYEKKFQDEALIRTIHHGTHLEGNDLNLIQAEQVLQGQDVVGRERDIQEVINYRKAMDYIGQLQKKGDSWDVSEETILHLHRVITLRILSDGLCGVFRKTQVIIRNNQTGEVTFRPPVAQAIASQINDLLQFVNNVSQEEMHPVLKSGIVHYEFVRIHPFVDGNGRAARALATLILFIDEYDIRKFFALEEYFDYDAGSYYESLQSVSKNGGDLTTWLEYYTQGLAIELTKIKEKVERISIDSKLKEKLGGKPLLLSDRQLKIIEYIQKVGFLQNNAFKQLFPFVSEDTVLNELKALINSGIIRKTGKTKAAKYVMN